MSILKKIDQIKFGLMSPEQIKEMSVVNVTSPDTYDEDGYPIENGLMDSRLGVFDPNLKCGTCGEKGGKCPGHFGHIELARPVIHVGFAEDIYKILRSTCNNCGRVLLEDDEIEEYTEKLNELEKAGKGTEELIKHIYGICKKRKTREICPHCGVEQEDIKFVKPFNFILARKNHEGLRPFSHDLNDDFLSEDYDLTPSEVREMLEKIPDIDSYVLGVNPKVARPEWMVLTVLPVSPVTLRPDIILDTGEHSFNDLTHKLVDVLRINQRFSENLKAGVPEQIINDFEMLLQYHVTTYFDNETLGVPPARHRSGRPLETLAQRFKGEEGRFRSYLTNVNPNHSAQGVVSPDPTLTINEIGVPAIIAKELTIPTYVTEDNLFELKEAILKGSNVPFGASYVKKFNPRIKDFNKVRIFNSNKEIVADNLNIGDIVIRHLKDGDIVLINHNLSLAKNNLMAHEVKIIPYKTFRLNPCLSEPYNINFDGEEIGMYVLQDYEARAEARLLMRAQENILSPRFGGPVIGAVQDYITGAYLLTRDGFEFTEEQAFQAIHKAHLLNNPYVDKKHLKRKNRNWTGKEVFSLLLPDDLNMIYRAEICKKCQDGCMGEACEHDAYVVIKDGQLTHGAIDEGAIGPFCGKILDTIVKEYGPTRAKEFLSRSTELTICAIMKTGITTSTNDEEIPEKAIEVIDAHIYNAKQKIDRIIELYEMGELIALPGKNEEETLEMRIVQVLGETRDVAGDIAAGYITMGKQDQRDTYHNVMATENHSAVMAVTGSGVSMLNLAQMMACVGQQSIRGNRIKRGYINRVLPHFRKHEYGLKPHGFVHSSYKEGLDPIEFFFHAIGGRDSMVDKSIRTKPYIYMQKQLSNALGDLRVESNDLVTDSNGQIIQTVYGEDGISPQKSDFGKVANLDRLIDEMRIEKSENFSLSKKLDVKGYKPYVIDTKENTYLIEESFIEKTSEYGNCYSFLENLINERSNQYNEITEDLNNIKVKIQDLNKDVRKIDYLSNSVFPKKSRELLSNINMLLRQFNNELSEIISSQEQFNSLKSPDYKFSNSYELNSELDKINTLMEGLKDLDVDRFKKEMDDANAICSDLFDDFYKTVTIFKPHREHSKDFEKIIDKTNIELSKNSNFIKKVENLYLKAENFDKFFAKIYKKDINGLLDNIYLIKENYNFYLDLKKDLINKLNEFINSLDFNSLNDLKNRVEQLNFIIEGSNYDFSILEQDYEEQLLAYNHLKTKEIEFSEKYSYLNDFDIDINDFDNEVLENLSKFETFKSSVDYYKYIVQISPDHLKRINDDVIYNIISKKIVIENNNAFKKYYENLVEEFSDEEEEEPIIEEKLTKEEFKVKYSELYNLGFRYEDLNDDILFIFDKFKNFTTGSVYKFKTISLASKEINLINSNIIFDIASGKISGTVFSSVYEHYLLKFYRGDLKEVPVLDIKDDENIILSEDSSNDEEKTLLNKDVNEDVPDKKTIISDEELEQDYKELFDLGFRSQDIDEDILNKINQFNNHFNKPAFRFKIKTLSVSDENISLIKEQIMVDIVNKVLIDNLNFDDIFKDYSNKIEDENEDVSIDWDDIFENNDLNNYDEDIIDFAKETVEKEFNNKEITLNDVENKFKFYLNKKLKERNDLNELNMIMNDSNSPEIQRYLTPKEKNLIYNTIQSKISSTGISVSVYYLVEKEMENRIELNKSNARRALELYTSNIEQFLQMTGLDENQRYGYIDEIHKKIENNEVKEDMIDVEFIRITTEEYNYIKKVHIIPKRN